MIHDILSNHEIVSLISVHAKWPLIRYIICFIIYLQNGDFAIVEPVLSFIVTDKTIPLLGPCPLTR